MAISNVLLWISKLILEQCERLKSSASGGTVKLVLARQKKLMKTILMLIGNEIRSLLGMVIKVKKLLLLTI